jgi:hypothetical protein
VGRVAVIMLVGLRHRCACVSSHVQMYLETRGQMVLWSRLALMRRVVIQYSVIVQRHRWQKIDDIDDTHVLAMCVSQHRSRK